jgi:hypothetical protein
MGYVPFGPNLIGFLSVRVPVRVSPYVLTILPLLQAFFGFGLFFAKAFRVYVRSDALRFTACLAMALAPVGQFHLLCHTDFSIWSALLIAFLLALLPMPRRRLNAILVFLFGQLFVWSNPLSFVAAPVHAARGLCARRGFARVYQALWVGAHAAHVAYGVEHGAAARLWAQLAEAKALLALVERTWWHVAFRGCFRALWGADATLWALGHRPVVHVFAALFFFVALALASLRRRTAKCLLYLGLPYFIAALTAVIVATKSEAAIAGGPQRYHYVQCLLVVVLFVLMLAEAGSKLRPWLRSAFWPLLSVAICVPFAVMALQDQQQYLEPYPENGRRVRACMERIAQLEQVHGGRPCGFHYQCHKVNDWTISLRPPACE